MRHKYQKSSDAPDASEYEEIYRSDTIAPSPPTDPTIGHRWLYAIYDDEIHTDIQPIDVHKRVSMAAFQEWVAQCRTRSEFMRTRKKSRVRDATTLLTYYLTLLRLVS